MSYILLLIYLAVLLWAITQIQFFNQAGFPKYVPSLVFLSKFIGGIAVYIVYANFYGSRMSGDIFKYFDDGNVIFSSLKQNPIDYIRMITGIGSDDVYLQKYYDTCRYWNKHFNYGLINDNRIVIRFNALVRLFSMGNMHIHTLAMSFISFIGLWGIFNVFVVFFKKHKWVLLVVIFFFPSVFFWTSGVLKEGILMFAFGMFIYHFNELLTKTFKTKNLVWIIIATFLLLLSKFYVLVAILPGLLFFMVIQKTGKRYFYIKLLSSIGIFIVFSLFSKPIFGVGFTEVIERKQHDFIAYTNSLNEVGSKVEIPDIDPTLTSLLKNSPEAFLRTLFRPTLLEVNNLMGLMAALENTIIVLMMVLSIIFFHSKNLKNSSFWLCVIFVIVLFTLTGLTTPVLGALVRYKSPALPFLGIAFMFLINLERIEAIRKK